MSLLNRFPFKIKFRSGLAANINATATVNTAIEGEPHWTTDEKRLYVFDGTQNKGVIMEATAGVPATAADTGTPGDIAFDSSYLYICIATDTWVRAAVATW